MNLIATAGAGRNRPPGQDDPRVRAGRHRDRQRQRRRRRAQARPGLRRRRHRQAQPRPQLVVHRAQDLERRRRRADVPDLFAADRRRSRSSAAATCAAPSSTTCATARASRRGSAKSSRTCAARRRPSSRRCRIARAPHRRQRCGSKRAALVPFCAGAGPTPGRAAHSAWCRRRYRPRRRALSHRNRARTRRCTCPRRHLRRKIRRRHSIGAAVASQPSMKATLYEALGICPDRVGRGGPRRAAAR